jgi:hypothetical protein
MWLWFRTSGATVTLYFQRLTSSLPLYFWHVLLAVDFFLTWFCGPVWMLRSSALGSKTLGTGVMHATSSSVKNYDFSFTSLSLQATTTDSTVLRKECHDFYWSMKQKTHFLTAFPNSLQLLHFSSPQSRRNWQTDSTFRMKPVSVSQWVHYRDGYKAFVVCFITRWLFDKIPTGKPRCTTLHGW